MRVKINSYIVGMKQKPGSILVVGEDITEEQAARLLSMGKEAELVQENPVNDEGHGAPEGSKEAGSSQGPWFGMPEIGQGAADANQDTAGGGNETTPGKKAGRKSRAAS
jgi:hypothetical protein